MSRAGVELNISTSFSGGSSSTSSLDESSSSGLHLGKGETMAHPPAHFIFETSDTASGSERISHSVGAMHDADLEQMSAPNFGWSKGAARHDVGKCTPCINVATGVGCQHNENCNFCHLSHESDFKRSRRRPCKASRNRYKRLIEELSAKYKDDPEAKSKEILRLACNNPYMRGLLMGASEHCEEDQDIASHGPETAVPSTEDRLAACHNLHATQNPQD
eukprot:TRINITY_DN59073_c0_g1_i1.p1 TRINITY_DN59073_c0_g1~~TRINITY_DN59073_c0_g1_i1.p1  ORF type:complete len:219 (-),score=27.47 TRINITY_DN59073_c0_g1_i1:80-736(-)